MRLGIHLRELWRLRLGVAVSAVLAVVVALTTGGTHQIATASTQVLVDTPRSKLTDLRANTYDLSSLTTRAGLLGNIMVSEPVRTYIAARAGVPADRIEATAPITANFPRALKEPGSEKRASDILRSTDQYRLDVEANPTVPILGIYTQAPNRQAAERLASASVAGLQTYLSTVAGRERLGANKQVRLLQLGTPSGGVINQGIGKQIAVLTFVVVFALGCCAVLLLDRVRRGWLLAARRERDEPLGMPGGPSPAPSASSFATRAGGEAT